MNGWLLVEIKGLETIMINFHCIILKFHATGIEINSIVDLNNPLSSSVHIDICKLK